MQSLDDTIAAIATAPGAAGLAVVRVSGPDALRMADAVFEGGTALARAAGHTLHHGWAVARGADTTSKLDEVVAGLFRAPRSYTGEDTVEFSCHGGGVPARRVLAALQRAGARLATAVADVRLAPAARPSGRVARRRNRTPRVMPPVWSCLSGAAVLEPSVLQEGTPDRQSRRLLLASAREAFSARHSAARLRDRARA